MFVNLNSPLQQLKHPLRKSIVVKRDDLIDPYISGNKWRKLKYTVEEARIQEKKHLVTFGGAYSNHLVAAAAACARTGLKCTGFVRGEQVDNELLMLCRLYGMHLIFTERTEYKEKRVLFEKHFGLDHDAFFVDEGGAGPLAVKGCAELVDELPNDTDHIFCAAGTGTTAAGLLKGVQQSGRKTKIHVIPVLKGGAFIADEIAGYTGNIDQLVLHTGYHFGGYAKTNPELIAYIKRFTAEEGMLIDPVYTAKMFFAIDDLISQNYFGENDRIIAIHTGGLLGILGMKEKFS
ncbi:MAG TPA: pyridoxal-phosphate dependent enzyme [Pedobacter sp.]|nr:pyridoxal-phosphate dependent enzyme [Pedobacter sp.]